MAVPSHIAQPTVGIIRFMQSAKRPACSDDWLIIYEISLVIKDYSLFINEL